MDWSSDADPHTNPRRRTKDSGVRLLPNGVHPERAVLQREMRKVFFGSTEDSGRPPLCPTVSDGLTHAVALTRPVLESAGGDD